MQLTLGHHYHHRDNPLSGQPFTWDPQELINAHMVMTGDSGSGKTHNLRMMCRQMTQTAGPGLQRIHILDSHGDIDVPSSHVQFSQSTPYAFNPLEVNPDPHFGGVRRSVANFLGMIQRSSRKLGTTQESVLRNLLLDVYMSRGFHPDNPATWGLDGGAGRPEGLQAGRVYLDVPFEEKELAKDIARREGVTFQFDAGARSWWASAKTPGLERWPEKTWGKQYPTIHDVISLAQFKLKQIFLGTDQKGLIALEAFCRSQAALLSKIKSTLKRSASEDEETLQDERDRAAAKAKDAMANFIDRIATGTELEDLIRYESADTLKGLLDRLDNLKATGVCRSVAPPYDEDALVWRYGLRAYGDDEKRMFVENLLERIFQRAVARGEVDEITDVVIIDEAPKFMVDDGGHIICRIVNEARKFGVALVLVAQTPTQYPEQILAGVGCKIILGLDPMYHRMAANKLALDQKFIEKIQPRKLIFVNQKFKGSVARWAPVQLA
jgi:energy-coupling factor transporter ATP-binding protein EcfA2